ncbi:galactose oxidase-like domain-containing protein [Actinophytocola sp.]|uniref:galactose oxidase-like domain-containing protein n=1 Tax=Actinophytocola sp. TaxID=1872138 RepID=UPI00389A3676
MLRRRALLASGLAVGGAAIVAAAPSPARAEPTTTTVGQPDPLAIDVSSEDFLRGPRKRMSLRIDDSDPDKRDAPAGQLLLSTTGKATAVTLQVTHNRVDFSTSRDGARSPALTVNLSTTPTTLWVFPRDVGEPQQAADQIHISHLPDPAKTVTVDVWIEPIGGQWRPLTGADGKALDLGVVAVHAALVRKKDNKGAEVLMYSPPRERDRSGKPLQNPDWRADDPERAERWQWDAHDVVHFEARVLDLTDLEVRDTANTPERNLFCSGLAHQYDGSVLVVGGHIFGDHNGNGRLLHTYGEGTWTKLSLELKGRGRWYPSVTGMPDGRMLITTGSWDCFWHETDFWQKINETYLLYDPSPTLPPTTPRLTKENKLLGARKSDIRDQNNNPMVPEGVVDPTDDRVKAGKLATYPGVFPLPNGANGTMVVMVECTRGWIFDLRADRSAPLPSQTRFYSMSSEGSRSYPWYGSPVLLPITVGATSFSVLVPGGQAENDKCRMRCTATDSATTAEIFTVTPTSGGAQATWKTVPMLRPRYLCDATLLADGTVLVSGGAQKGFSDQNLQFVYDAELYDPVAGVFRPAAKAHTTRRYHSVALLLPDGSVLKTGSTGGFAEEKPDLDPTFHPKLWFRTRTDAERFLPGYLWRGPRPTIEPLSDRQIRYLSPKEEFQLRVMGEDLDNARVALIRLGAVTHGYDTDQRFVWLEAKGYYDSGDTWTVHVTMAPDLSTTPPGDYQLVVLDNLGVPSPGEIVRVK